MTEKYIRQIPILMYFGFSPGRMAHMNYVEHSFDSGVFMSSSPVIAANYAADWTARTRSNKREFIYQLIKSEFINGDPEACGFIKEN